MEYYEEELVTEYSSLLDNKFISKSTIQIKAPSNSLHYMKFNSEEYLKYKFDLKVRDKIKMLNLEERIVKEISEGCYNYKKKNNDKEDNIKISDLISIFTYKIIKKYDITISHSEAFKKLDLNKSKYLKYSKLINLNYDLKVEDDHAEKENFNSSILKSLNYMIANLIRIYPGQPNIIKLQLNKLNISKCLEVFTSDNLYDKNLKESKNLNDKFDSVNMNVNYEKSSNVRNKSFNESYFIDNVKLIETVRNDVKSLLESRNTEVDFFHFFNNKITYPETISAGLIKYFLEKKGIKINLSFFQENFKIPSASISKIIKSINEYIKYK